MLLGSQIPRFNTTPDDVEFSDEHGEDAIWYAQKYGLTADPWQETVVCSWLRVTADQMWACAVAGVTVARQNGKNGALEIVELYLMAQLSRKILHTAQEVKTARKAFLRLKHFFGNEANDKAAKFPELNAMVAEVRNTNGQEAIFLKNGGSIEFIARSKNSGRGFTVDVLVLDEAQDLHEDQLQALLPTISAGPAQNPMTIYMGTPPSTEELSKGNGLPFMRVRTNALKQKEKVAWVEFGARGFVEDMTPEELAQFVQDVENHANGNPAYNRRILPSTIAGELSQFSPESFARERLNIWPKSLDHISVIPDERWNDRASELPVKAIADTWQTGAFGIDMNLERNKVSISVGSYVPDDEQKIVIELIAAADYDEGGTPKLVSYLWERAKRIHPIIIDGRSPAVSLVPHLKKKKMKVYVLGGSEFVEASMGFYDAVMRDKTIEHHGEPRLDQSVEGLGKANVDKTGAQWKFVPMDLTKPFHPIMSAVCSHYGTVKFVRRRIGGGAAQEAGSGFG